VRAAPDPSTAIALFAAFALASALAACRIHEPFSCGLDEHCGPGGRCEPAGFCSFGDGACPSGRRYDELAGDDQAEQCVPVLVCPASYAAMLPGSNSRYRAVGPALSWLGAEQDCADDGQGTHLIVIGSETERSGLRSLLDDDVWIGYSDRVAEDEFRWVTGVDLPFEAWASGRPDDANGDEDCAQQKRRSGEWDDQSCTDLYLYVCECDGFAPDPAAF